MSDGKKHGIATVLLTVPTGFAVGYLAQSIIDIPSMIGCLIGLIIDPDLDVNGLTKSKTRLSKIALPLTYLWALLWSIYSWGIPHRHWISHLPIVGTVGRLSYLIVILSLISMGYFGQWLVTIPYDILFRFFIGLAVSDTAHFIMDKGKLRW